MTSTCCKTSVHLVSMENGHYYRCSHCNRPCAIVNLSTHERDDTHDARSTPEVEGAFVET